MLRDDEIYEEIWVDVKSTTPVTFPNRCPICKAPITLRKSEGTRWETVIYLCGGAYISKPQIQNHTDKWWGSCGAKKE